MRCWRLVLFLFFISGMNLVLAKDKPYILLQSSTSTANSGLYDYLLPKFTEVSGIEVHVVAVGTGQAIKNARNGDADVLIVHAKEYEEKFVQEGYGIERYDVMYNDFIIIGPDEDPAKIKGLKSATEAFAKIAQADANFASRGDDSGTHKKERGIWRAVNINVDTASGSWYREIGAGMGATLNTAIGMEAYTITDRGTWISFGNKKNYQVMVQGDPVLFNQYGVIIVNPKRHPHVKLELAQQFVDWILGGYGQTAIANYWLQGQQLFFPNAIK